MSETELSRGILTAVNTIPHCRFVRVQASGGPTRRIRGAGEGCPDYLGYVGNRRGPAVFCGLEVKTAAGRKRKTGRTFLAQKAWRGRATKAGAFVFVVSDAAEAVEAVKWLQREQ